MSNLTLRLLSGSVYVIIMVLVAIYGNPYLTVWFALLVFFSLNEISTLAQSQSKQQQFLNPLLFAGVLVYASLFLKRELSVLEIWGALGIQVMGILILYLSLTKQKKVNSTGGVLYLFAPLAVLVLAYHQFSHSAYYLLFYFIAIWGYDSFAYSTGKLIGKTPVFPKISPKKTVEGTVGGIVLTLVLLFVLNTYWLKLDLNVLMAGTVVILFAIAGDFVESFMKRSIGVKDSGSIMPGHGGILDRLDSIYLSAIPYTLIVWYA
jgi:phosphatidate cytidylyltransferase